MLKRQSNAAIKGEPKQMAKKDSYYFEELGDKFDEYISDYDVARRSELIFAELLGAVELGGQKVLEVGCGTGRFSQQIADQKAQLMVLDIASRLVSEVAERLGCVGVAGDACNLPFDDETFDVVISSECIEHTPLPQQAVAEMCRVCRNGGVVCLTTPNKLWYPVLWLCEKLRIRKFAGTENWVFPGQVKKIMRREGMSDIMVSGCHLWPFQLKFTRRILRWLDGYGRVLYPIMINFGITGKKQGTSSGENEAAK